MNGKYIFAVLLISSVDGFKQIEFGTEEESVLEVIRNYDKKLHVDAFVCWNIDKLARFAIKLSNANILSQMRRMEDFELPPPDRAHTNIILFDLRCDNFTSVLNHPEIDFLFRSPYKSIFFVQNYLPTEEPFGFDVFENLVKIGTDSDVTLIFENDLHRFLPPVSVYNLPENNDLFIYPKTKEINAIRRLNLQGSLIRISFVLTNNDSINHLYDYKFKEIDTITKVNFILTNHLVDFVNGSRSYTFVNSWGYKNTVDGSWSGMIGELTKNEADIGGSPLFFTSDRVDVIDYIAMPTPTKSKFVFRQPKLSYMSNVFILPFRTGVWVSSLALVVILVIFLYVSSKWEWLSKFYPSTNDVDNETLRPNWIDAIVMTFGAVCQQGSNVQLKGPVGRIVILLLFLSLMFLYTSYSANIVALLQSSSSRIKTLSDLLNSRLKFGVHDTVFNRYYFSTATEPVRKAIYQKKIAIPGEKPRFITLEEGVSKLRDGLFAFHMETGVGYKVVSEIFHEGEKCGLQEIQYLQVIDPWLAVQKNSTYKEMFKIGFRRIHEFGLQSRENSLLYTKKPKCSGTGSNFISVGIVDCRPALVILGYGGVIAVIFVFFEFLCFRCLTKKKVSLSNSTTD